MVYSGVEVDGRCNQFKIKPEINYDISSLGVGGNIDDNRRIVILISAIGIRPGPEGSSPTLDS